MRLIIDKIKGWDGDGIGLRLKLGRKKGSGEG